MDGHPAKSNGALFKVMMEKATRFHEAHSLGVEGSDTIAFMPGLGKKRRDGGARFNPGKHSNGKLFAIETQGPLMQPPDHICHRSQLTNISKPQEIYV